VTELYARSWALDDIEIVRTADGGGDGRTVRAYAAVFDVAAEIQDQHGHYMERIDRKAFNRQLGRINSGQQSVHVLYNHGLTAHGTPASGTGSVPIGSPVEIKADGKGLLTVTRYNKSELADHVIEAIRNGDIRGYSFRGRIFKSNPDRLPPVRRGGSLPTVVRTELGLSEYGPTPTPAYMEAGILAIRAALRESGLSPEQLVRMLASTPPDLADLGQGMHSAPLDSSGSGDNTDQPPASSDGEPSRVPQLKLSLQARLRDRGLA
jgi:HK97 family phage prohead protease